MLWFSLLRTQPFFLRMVEPFYGLKKNFSEAHCFQLCPWFFFFFFWMFVCGHDNSWKAQPIRTKFSHMTFEWNSSAKFEDGHRRSHVTHPNRGLLSFFFLYQPFIAHCYAKAFPLCFHHDLSSAILLHDTLPSSLSISSLHLVLGLPLPLPPYHGLHSVVFLIHLSVSCLHTWPAHLHLLFLTVKIISLIFCPPSKLTYLRFQPIQTKF